MPGGGPCGGSGGRFVEKDAADDYDDALELPQGLGSASADICRAGCTSPASTCPRIEFMLWRSCSRANRWRDAVTGGRLERARLVGVYDDGPPRSLPELERGVSTPLESCPLLGRSSVAASAAARIALASACELMLPSSDGSIVRGGVASLALPLPGAAAVLTVPAGVQSGSPLHVDVCRSVTGAPGEVTKS